MKKCENLSKELDYEKIVSDILYITCSGEKSNEEKTTALGSLGIDKDVEILCKLLLDSRVQVQVATFYDFAYLSFDPTNCDPEEFETKERGISAFIDAISDLTRLPSPPTQENISLRYKVLTPLQENVSVAAALRGVNDYFGRDQLQLYIDGFKKSCEALSEKRIEEVAANKFLKENPLPPINFCCLAGTDSYSPVDRSVYWEQKDSGVDSVFYDNLETYTRLFYLRYSTDSSFLHAFFERVKRQFESTSEELYCSKEEIVYFLRNKNLPSDIIEYILKDINSYLYIAFLEYGDLDRFKEENQDYSGFLYKILFEGYDDYVMPLLRNETLPRSFLEKASFYTLSEAAQQVASRRIFMIKNLWSFDSDTRTADLHDTGYWAPRKWDLGSDFLKRDRYK